MTEIQTYCEKLAKKGIYGHDLIAEATKHFSDPNTLVDILFDGTPLAKLIINAFKDCIQADILHAAIKINAKMLSQKEQEKS